MRKVVKIFHIRQKSNCAEKYCKKLMNAAAKFEGTPWEFPDWLLRDIFIQNLSDEQCRTIVTFKQPSTLQEACDFANEWEECMRICYSDFDPCGLERRHSDTGGVSLPPNDPTKLTERSSLMKILLSRDIPRDLAAELSELLEEIHCSTYLIAHPTNNKKDDPRDLWSTCMSDKNREANHTTIPMKLEFAKMWIGPGRLTQLKAGGALLSWRARVPNLLRKANKELPNNISFPGIS
eukprot:Gregarina_sp_Poly_1__7620@NODE_427_length_8580_cov_90_016211_g348_i0_p5_GENE_NODE_427_length_8580_cov_90_016211_g348_i0NODE_427_length_8580_cov_90_016211_g348_i0_p5_ORF_typecomplete_len236_score29_22PAN_3/PF08277_12/0_39PAN_3/PF08277_12/4_5e03_NODE_427_length_8580_cov_90_016211_g348_i09511658